MKVIAYYISDYGYGHAARSVAIIRKLIDIKEDIRIIVCHSYALDFLKQSLIDSRVEFKKVQTDIGYFLKEGSIQPDKDAMNVEYRRYISGWNQQIHNEIDFLTSQQVNLVISDISPLPFEAAHTIDIPSIGISNFTWYTAYQYLIQSTFLEPYRLAYEKMNYFYELAGSDEPPWNNQKIDYGFYAREVDLDEICAIRNTVNPNGDKKIVFFGLGMKMDLQDLENLPIWDSSECTFIVSANVPVNRKNVHRIPANYLESQNFIAASDLVVTKAGWGMVSEAVCSKVPLLIVDRKGMKEDYNTIEFLKKNHLCQTISWEDLKQLVMTKELFDEIDQKVKMGTVSNDAEKIARDIINLIH
nr:glycosyltransferase family protein [Fredinandcohnia onubensis]